MKIVGRLSAFIDYIRKPTETCICAGSTRPGRLHVADLLSGLMRRTVTVSMPSVASFLFCTLLIPAATPFALGKDTSAPTKTCRFTPMTVFQDSDGESIEAPAL